jgi:hypothetical protein
MLREVTLAAALGSLVHGLALAQQTKAPPTAADSAAYSALVARARAGDTTADFTALRMLYVKFAPDSPSGPTPAELFARARKASDSLVARAQVDSVLDTYYGHIQAHIDAERVFRERGDSTRARSEDAIVRAFLASIGANGGLTRDTAMPVTNLAEEYAFLASKGMRREGQALVTCGTGRCDALTGADSATGTRVTYYFRLSWW